MLTAEQLSEFLELRIGHILTGRMGPMMYCGSAPATEVVLNHYLEIWSRLHERFEEYDTVRHQRLASLKAESAGFAIHYRRRNKSQTEFHAANYVALQFKKIVKQMQVPIPWRQIKAERNKILRSIHRESK